MSIAKQNLKFSESSRTRGNYFGLSSAALLVRIIIVPIYIVLIFLFSFVNMIIDVYLMADSFYDGSQLTNRVQSFVNAFSAFFNNLKPLPLFHLIPPLKFSFDIIVVFTLPIPVEGGVSCVGMQAPMYLLELCGHLFCARALRHLDIFVLRMSPEDLKPLRQMANSLWTASGALTNDRAGGSSDFNRWSWSKC